MTHGIVSTFDASSGFGYIVADDGTRLFVDFTAATDATVLRAGERVTFQTIPGAMGIHATCVRTALRAPAVPA